MKHYKNTKYKPKEKVLWVGMHIQKSTVPVGSVDYMRLVNYLILLCRYIVGITSEWITITIAN